MKKNKKLFAGLGSILAVIILIFTLGTNNNPVYLINNAAVTSATTNTALTSQWVGCDYDKVALSYQVDDSMKIAFIVDFMYGTDTTFYVSLPADTVASTTNTKNSRFGRVLKGYGSSEYIINSSGGYVVGAGGTITSGTTTGTTNLIPGANRMRVRAIGITYPGTGSGKLNVGLMRGD